MRFWIRAAMVAVLVICAFGVGPSTLLAQGNVEGTTYTSPHFDYQVQWGTPWFFLDEWTEQGTDFLAISDGESQVIFSFTYDPAMDAATLINLLTTDELNTFLTDIAPILDAQGAPIAGVDGSHAWSAITGTTTLDDGSTVEMAFYLDAQGLPGGIVYLMTASTPSYFYNDAALQDWQNLASTALVSPEPPASEPTFVPKPEPSAIPSETPIAEDTPTPIPVETAVPETPESSPAAGNGEPAPVMATGSWRVAVRAVDLGETIDYLGLGFVDGQQWVVVYADVANWSDTDTQLEIASLTLATAGGPVAPDAASTQSTASQLGLEPANGEQVLVPAGGSVRLALVYSIPVTDSPPMLEIGDTRLPLEDAVGRQLDVTDLSTIARPPALVEGVVSSAPLSGTEVTIKVDTGDGPQLIVLAGVEIPDGADCYDGFAGLLLRLDALAGEHVWLEADPEATGPDSYYVWTEDPQGNRLLLNQVLTADGLVVEGDLPEAARFGAWIEQTEANAQASGDGLWSDCAGQL